MGLSAEMYMRMCARTYFVMILFVMLCLITDVHSVETLEFDKNLLLRMMTLSDEWYDPIIYIDTDVYLRSEVTVSTPATLINTSFNPNDLPSGEIIDICPGDITFDFTGEHHVFAKDGLEAHVLTTSSCFEGGSHVYTGRNDNNMPLDYINYCDRTIPRDCGFLTQTSPPSSFAGVRTMTFYPYVDQPSVNTIGDGNVSLACEGAVMVQETSSAGSFGHTVPLGSDIPPITVTVSTEPTGSARLYTLTVEEYISDCTAAARYIVSPNCTATIKNQYFVRDDGNTDPTIPPSPLYSDDEVLYYFRVSDPHTDINAVIETPIPPYLSPDSSLDWVNITLINSGDADAVIDDIFVSSPATVGLQFNSASCVSGPCPTPYTYTFTPMHIPVPAGTVVKVNVNLTAGPTYAGEPVQIGLHYSNLSVTCSAETETLILSLATSNAPDYIIQAPSTLTAPMGSLVTVEFNTTNIGGERGGSSSTTWVWQQMISPSGASVTTLPSMPYGQNIPDLLVSQSWHGGFNVMCPADQQVNISYAICADYEDVISELDETNNCEQVDVLCGYEEAPNLWPRCPALPTCYVNTSYNLTLTVYSTDVCSQNNSWLNVSLTRVLPAPPTLLDSRIYATPAMPNCDPNTAASPCNGGLILPLPRNGYCRNGTTCDTCPHFTWPSIRQWNITYAFTPTIAGSYMLNLSADYFGDVSESSETDNYYSCVYNCIESPEQILPDLVPECSSGTGTIGDVITLEITTQNIGMGDANASVTSVTGAFSTIFNINPLPGWQSDIIPTPPIPAQTDTYDYECTAPGTFSYTVEVDSTNTNTEQPPNGENNNVATCNIVCTTQLICEDYL